MVAECRQPSLERAGRVGRARECVSDRVNSRESQSRRACGLIGLAPRARSCDMRRMAIASAQRSGRSPKAGIESNKVPSTLSVRNSAHASDAGAIVASRARARPRHQQFDVAPMALDGGAHGVRPSEQLHTGAVAAFSGQRLRNVDDGVGVEREFRQLRGQARWSSRIRLEHGRKARRAPRPAASRVTV